MSMRYRSLAVVVLSASSLFGCSADGSQPETKRGTPSPPETSLAPVAAAPTCPDDDSALSANREAKKDALTAVPADVSSVLLCTVEGASMGAIHPLASEPLVAVTDPSQAARVAEAVNAPPPIGNTRGCGIGSPRNVLVFQHADGAVTFGLEVAPSCSFLTDGRVSRGVPQEVAALLPGSRPAKPA